ncbi:cysteine-rich KTR domain-containing protein [Shouchella clausii]|uniref:cysteine-rich KTR domain-containing protein n=1 Tax=Shouchella clausii TaxID=79880 RepID=UPI003D15CD8C
MRDIAVAAQDGYLLILENFPLFCPKCKKKNLINVQQLNMSVIKEPDAKTQSR